jgi:hypothetical protein
MTLSKRLWKLPKTTSKKQNNFRFSSYLLRKPHLFVILIAIGWFIINIQSDLFWHRCLERQTFGTPRMYTLSPSKSIKRSNYREFLKDKNVILLTSVLQNERKLFVQFQFRILLELRMTSSKVTEANPYRKAITTTDTQSSYALSFEKYKEK